MVTETDLHMKLYKYMSLENLWRVLDIVVMQRVYCAHWEKLNDPLEGRFMIVSEIGDPLRPGLIEQAMVRGKIDRTGVAALSSNPVNLLLWSHYANADRGVAVEVEIPDEMPELVKVMYSSMSAAVQRGSPGEFDPIKVYG